MMDNRRLCIVINQSGAALRPSESFLHAHISRLKGTVLPLIGSPTVRRTGLETDAYLLRQTLPFRGARWLQRKSRTSTIERQETKSLVDFFRRQRVQVVMAEYGPSALDVMEACRIAELPLITHFHGWDAYVLASNPKQADAYRTLFERSTAIVAVSRHMQAHLRSLGAPPAKVVWNPCGADVRGIPEASPASAPPLFISVGRPTPKKAAIVSLLAFAQVVRDIPTARLELIGAGLDAPSLQAVRALRIEHTVSFVGPQPHKSILERLAGARCYLHPSVTAPDGDMEGTPVSVMEAMAAGLPVVSTRHGGIMDLLEDTDAGILADEYDVDATAAAMLVYGQDPARAAADGAEGKRLMHENWSMEHSLRKLDRIIELACAGDHAGIARMAMDDTLKGPEHD